MVVKSTEMRWVGHVTCMKEMRDAYDIPVEKLEEKRLFWIRRHIWEEKIKYLKGTECEG
jgi:hypothetical protein